jgi:hypothetical protein
MTYPTAKSAPPLPIGAAAPLDDPTRTVIAYIEGLAAEHFWGFLSLKFENGKVVHLRKEENLKPQDLPGKCRGENYDTERREQSR